MPQLRPSVRLDLAEHPIPNLALAANHEVRIVLVEIGDRLHLGELVTVDHQPDDLIAAVAHVVGNDSHRKSRLGVTEASEKLTLGLHQLAEGEKPRRVWKRRHQLASKSLLKSVGRIHRGRRSSPAESHRCRYSWTIRRHNCPCNSIPLSKFLSPPPIRIAIGSTASGTLKVSSRIRSASSSCTWSSSATAVFALSCARRCIVPNPTWRDSSCMQRRKISW